MPEGRGTTTTGGTVMFEGADTFASEMLLTSAVSFVKFIVLVSFVTMTVGRVTLGIMPVALISGSPVMFGVILAAIGSNGSKIGMTTPPVKFFAVAF